MSRFKQFFIFFVNILTMMSMPRVNLYVKFKMQHLDDYFDHDVLFHNSQ